MTKLVVSCTTTKARLEFLYYMLTSLQRQTLSPDLLLVNVSSEPYLDDEGIKELPAWINSFNCTINWVSNTGPYRKLLPALDWVTDADKVVTADDDILYGPRWLEALSSLSDTHPDKIIAARARLMRRAPLGGWRNYNMWPTVSRTQMGLNVLPTGSGGVVYRKDLLDMEFLKDESCLSLAPRCDDLWFRIASLRKGTEVLVDPAINGSNLYIEHGLGLKIRNLNQETTLLRKAITYSSGYIKGLVGLNHTENDKAWDRIIRRHREVGSNNTHKWIGRIQ